MTYRVISLGAIFPRYPERGKTAHDHALINLNGRLIRMCFVEIRSFNRTDVRPIKTLIMPGYDRKLADENRINVIIVGCSNRKFAYILIPLTC